MEETVCQSESIDDYLSGPRKDLILYSSKQPDGKEFHYNSMVMELYSQHFKDLRKNNTLEKFANVVDGKIKYGLPHDDKTIESVLNMLNPDKDDKLTLDNFLNILSLAHYLNIKMLLNTGFKFILDNIHTTLYSLDMDEFTTRIGDGTVYNLLEYMIYCIFGTNNLVKNGPYGSYSAYDSLSNRTMGKDSKGKEFAKQFHRHMIEIDLTKYGELFKYYTNILISLL
jgi:hypothetical protein